MSEERKIEGLHYYLALIVGCLFCIGMMLAKIANILQAWAAK